MPTSGTVQRLRVMFFRARRILSHGATKIEAGKMDSIEQVLNEARETSNEGTSEEVARVLKQSDRSSISYQLYRELAGGEDDPFYLVIVKLLRLPEFADIEIQSIRIVLEFRDSWRVIEGQDVQVNGKITISKPVDIDAGMPAFTLYLNLPWALTAGNEDLAAGIHELLCGIQVKDGRPKKRAPDIVAHAPHLARYGVPVETPLAAMAVAHAMAHPATLARVSGFGFDPISGQGLLWDAKPMRQLDEVKIAK